MGLVVGVLGASGGLGASTLTAALADRALAVVEGCRASVAVDLDPRGGLDTVLCVEHLDGPRWPDLERKVWTEGASASVTVADLPGEEGVHVLAGVGDAVPAWPVVAEVLDALTMDADVVAVDCGARPVVQVLPRLDLLVVLAGMTAKGSADAVAAARSSSFARTRPVLVTRGSRRDRGGPTLGHEVGIPFLTHLPDDDVVPRHASEGRPPGALPSRVASVADEVLAMAQTGWLADLVGRLEGPRASA